MELILREGQIGLKQDLLIDGKEYRVKRDGKYIGVAQFIENEAYHGRGFFIDMGDGLKKVLVP